MIQRGLPLLRQLLNLRLVTGRYGGFCRADTVAMSGRYFCNFVSNLL